MAPRCASASRQITMPQSYGTLSHLCASVAHESARSTPATSSRRSRVAAAHSPNAPSTCTQAPCSCAAVDDLVERIERAGVHVARLRADDRRPASRRGDVAAQRVGAHPALVVDGDELDRGAAEAE